MNKQRWIILGGIGILFLVASGITAAVLYFNTDPEPQLLSEEELNDQEALTTAKYMASEDFAKLPDDQQQKYLDMVMFNHEKRGELLALRNQLSEAEQKQLRKNMKPVFRKRLKRHVDEYNALPLDEREGYLDNLIDVMQEMREKTPSRDRNRDGSGSARPRTAGSGRRRGPSPAGMKKWLETTTPADRAKTVQFVVGMMARLRARGISHRRHR